MTFVTMLVCATDAFNCGSVEAEEHIVDHDTSVELLLFIKLE